MKIVILYDQVADQSCLDQTDAVVQAKVVASALESLGHQWVMLGESLDLDMVSSALQRLAPDLCFNLVESLNGSGRLIHVVPGLLDSIGIPYTGVSAEGQFLTSNKLSAKTLMCGAGIPTPAWATLQSLNSALALQRGTYILKSVWEHSSIGLDENSIVDVSEENDPAESLLNALQGRLDALGGDAFAEAYIEGREFNLALLAASPNTSPQVLPPAEIVFEGYSPDQPRIVGWRAKWEEHSFEFHHTPRRYEFPPSDSSLLEHLTERAWQCWRLFDLRGYARVDFRVDQKGRPWVLEVNTNPCLSPDAGFAAALDRAGIPLHQAVERILADVPKRRGAAVL